VKHKPSWLWADAKSAAEMKKRSDAPAGMRGRDLTRWAREQAEAALQKHLDELDARLRPEIELSAENTGDELRFLVGGTTVIELFDQPDTPWIAAQWRQFARSTRVTTKFAARKLVSALLSLRETDDDALKQAVVALDAEIQILDEKIDRAEQELNRIICRLYGLSPDEIRLVERA
jgi:hypothetical protein